MFRIFFLVVQCLEDIEMRKKKKIVSIYKEIKVIEFVRQENSVERKRLILLKKINKDKLLGLGINIIFYRWIYGMKVLYVFGCLFRKIYSKIGIIKYVLCGLYKIMF